MNTDLTRRIEDERKEYNELHLRRNTNFRDVALKILEEENLDVTDTYELRCYYYRLEDEFSNAVDLGDLELVLLLSAETDVFVEEFGDRGDFWCCPFLSEWEPELRDSFLANITANGFSAITIAEWEELATRELPR